MQRITIAQAAEGMVLAKDVMTAENRILCGKGTVLSANIIERFRRLDLTHITVEGHPVAEAGVKSLEQELLAIEARFSPVSQIKPLMYLKKRIQARLLAAHRTPSPTPAQEEQK